MKKKSSPAESGKEIFNNSYVRKIEEKVMSQFFLFYLPAQDSLSVTGKHDANFAHLFSAHGESF